MKSLKEVFNKRVEKRDSEHLHPGERAQLIHELFFIACGLEDPREEISQPYLWDMVSYCVEFLGLYAQSTGEEDMLALAVAISQHIYSIHYALPDGHEALGPDRETHTRIWKNTIATLMEKKSGLQSDETFSSEESSTAKGDSKSKGEPTVSNG